MQTVCIPEGHFRCILPFRTVGDSNPALIILANHLQIHSDSLAEDFNILRFGEPRCEILGLILPLITQINFFKSCELIYILCF